MPQKPSSYGPNPYAALGQQTNAPAGLMGQNQFGGLGQIQEIDFTRGRAEAKPPYSFKLCEECGEYDFKKDFKQVQLRDDGKLHRNNKLKGIFKVVCWTCYENAYLDETESENEYKFRMALRKCK